MLKYEDMLKEVQNEMLDILYENRKDVYSTFEFDYLYRMKELYHIERHYQTVYIFTNKETNEKYYIEFFTKKEDNQYYIKKLKHGKYDF